MIQICVKCSEEMSCPSCENKGVSIMAFSLKTTSQLNRIEDRLDEIEKILIFIVQILQESKMNE